MKNLFWGRKSRFLFLIRSTALRTGPFLLTVSLTIFLAACAPASEAAQGEGPRDDCGFIEPSTADVKKILEFGKDAFTSEDWIRSYTVEPYKMSLTRTNDVEGAVAFTEYLVYTCGYGQSELAQYFNEEGFNMVFEGYEAHGLAAFCETGNLALYRYDLIDEGLAYTAHYWVKQEDDNHVLVMMLVFPKESAAQLDEYSKKIFPELTTCQK